MTYRIARPIAAGAALLVTLLSCAGEAPPPSPRGEEPDAGVAVPPVTPFARPPRLLDYDSAVAVLEAAYAAGGDTASGRLLVWIQLDTLGRIVEFRFPRSGTFPAVEAAVTQQAPGLRFEPARSGSGAPVPAWVQLPVDVRAGNPRPISLDTAAWLIPRFKALAGPLRPANPAEAESLLTAIVAPVARTGATGTVRLDLWVDTTGAVREAQLSSSSGHARLDEAVKRWARRLIFTPPTDTLGRRTEAWVNLPIRIGP